MNDFYFGEKAREDFNRARFKDFVSKIMFLLSPERHELLSFREARKFIKPENEIYKGMTVVQISKIVGSEGRYRDFNKAFLPRHEYLRSRWQNVDIAYLKDVYLPPIKLFELGGVYFVRDGNHRVSVAKSQGQKAIDAEVVKLSSTIKLKPWMTKNDLKKTVIQYEKKIFLEENPWILDVLSEDELIFTATGRYDEILNHIMEHKYFINEDKEKEILIIDAAKSWKETLFDPIIKIVDESNILHRFPGRAKSDLYVWIIRHWDELKKKFGEDLPIEEAALDYSSKFGKSLWTQFKELVKNIFHKLRY